MLRSPEPRKATRNSLCPTLAQNKADGIRLAGTFAILCSALLPYPCVCRKILSSHSVSFSSLSLCLFSWPGDISSHFFRYVFLWVLLGQFCLILVGIKMNTLQEMATQLPMWFCIGPIFRLLSIPLGLPGLLSQGLVSSCGHFNAIRGPSRERPCHFSVNHPAVVWPRRCYYSECH